MFQEIIAPVNQNFDIETALATHKGVKPTPFAGIDKSRAPVCEFFAEKKCSRGAFCPYRHVTSTNNVVCRHWLRGLCRRADTCDFLHEFDMTKMPECYFYSKFNACTNKDCRFLHLNPEQRIKECTWYTRGFCRLGGQACPMKHIKRTICQSYFVGFCPKGPACESAHPRLDILPNRPRNSQIICSACGEMGHIAIRCRAAKQ
ncbi:Cleavage and polyadenylation specificity factor subunit 4 [Hypsibius exemplaris]|uniref:Cleavage and polyadenylation specificity factor subunit 4 n=1 Tax=Hypsibius exemplaris TaxID=2072580 RepID=A0A9X6RMT5_HYPEX|nr:Cleavage and polyadenylation specificity factor subunit 4 [Hypsibius exemplaris]